MCVDQSGHIWTSPVNEPNQTDFPPHRPWNSDLCAGQSGVQLFVEQTNLVRNFGLLILRKPSNKP